MLKKIKYKSLEYVPNKILPMILKSFFFFKRKKRHIGKGTYIDPSVQLIHYGNISIGSYSAISEGSSLNVNQIKNDGFAINIGNNCYLGHHCFISAGNSVVIKDFASLARDCKILGSSHVISDPFSPYITTGTTHDCSIEIGVNCFFGVAVIINGDVKIGHGSVIGANTFIYNKNIPPFSVVVGNPSRIIKRYSMKFKQWVDIENFTEDDEKNLPEEGAYLKSLLEKHPRIPMFFHATGKNFGNLP
jgi:acetyltransferase-like isoleucine patch superfamily enzyme